jgi:hypothetical protein
VVSDPESIEIAIGLTGALAGAMNARAQRDATRFSTRSAFIAFW